MIKEKIKTAKPDPHSTASYHIGLNGEIMIHDSKKESTHMGYGACSSSGCYCKAYEGSAATCSNCGHSYEQHW